MGLKIRIFSACPGLFFWVFFAGFLGGFFCFYGFIAAIDEFAL